MVNFEVEPVPGYENEVLADYTALPISCADGFSVMIDILAEAEPGLRYRCGLIADRHELFAIPLPDCPERAMIVSINRRLRDLPRALHGTIKVSNMTCDQGARLAIRQFGLINPSWET